jgi:hypothetical protein
MRNAVKKRMRKLEESRREEWMREEARERVLQMVNTEFKTKYPPGSYIAFAGYRNKDEKLTTVSCKWYDKVGGKRPLQHKVYNPPEWQNISKEEADKIADMFDKNFLWVWVVY